MIPKPPATFLFATLLALSSLALAAPGSRTGSGAAAGSGGASPLQGPSSRPFSSPREGPDGFYTPEYRHQKQREEEAGIRLEQRERTRKESGEPGMEPNPEAPNIRQEDQEQERDRDRDRDRDREQDRERLRLQAQDLDAPNGPNDTNDPNGPNDPNGFIGPDTPDRDRLQDRLRDRLHQPENRN